MATINTGIMKKLLDSEALERSLRMLSIRLEENNAPPVELVVCGGSALVLLGMVQRVTKDVDVVALKRGSVLLSPDPLPDDLGKAVIEVAEDLGLSPEWLNNGPSRGEGGLFQMGLPEKFADRLHSRDFGSHLTVHFIDRIDQIYFKLYAAADRGGYHIEDLQALNPTNEELEAAARWAMTHDVSEGFYIILKDLLGELGYAIVVDRL